MLIFTFSQSVPIGPNFSTSRFFWKKNSLFSFLNHFFSQSLSFLIRDCLFLGPKLVFCDFLFLNISMRNFLYFYVFSISPNWTSVVHDRRSRISRDQQEWWVGDSVIKARPRLIVNFIQKILYVTHLTSLNHYYIFKVIPYYKWTSLSIKIDKQISLKWRLCSNLKL